MSRPPLLRLAAVALLCAACGGGATAPATGATSKATPATRSSRNIVRGEVVQVKDGRVTLTTNGVDTDFSFSPSTIVKQEQDAALTEATVGSCVFGIGKRTAPDLVTASQVVLGDHGPNGCRQGSGGAVDHLGVAGGQVTAIDGDIYTVASNAGPQRFQVTLHTKVVRLVDAPTSSLAVGQCVTARGPVNASGEVMASNVVISPSTASGCFATSGGQSGSGGG
jgi:hypothetical protein